MRVRIAKWGNSLGFRIPATLAKEVGASVNSIVELSVENGRLVAVPVAEIPVFELDDLVARITDENRHDEVATGQRMADEF